MASSEMMGKDAHRMTILSSKKKDLDNMMRAERKTMYVDYGQLLKRRNESRSLFIRTPLCASVQTQKKLMSCYYDYFLVFGVLMSMLVCVLSV